MTKTINKVIIGVGGGKGGTGKSIIASNLGVSLASAKKNVIIIDADLGASNLHSLFGIVTPNKTLDDFINRNVNSLEDVLLPTPLPNLQMICGGVALVGLADPTYDQKSRLINGINKLDADYLIVDIGAGSSVTAVDFYNNAHVKILVFSAQLTSLQNGYGFLKAAVYRRITRSLRRKYGENDPRLKTLDLLVRNSDQVQNILQVLDKLNPEYRKTIESELLNYNTFIIGNMFRKNNSKDTLTSMHSIIRDYLLLDAQILGVINFCPEIHDSINKMVPFMLNNANRNHEDHLTFLNITKKILTMNIDLEFTNQDNFFEEGQYEEKGYAAEGEKIEQADKDGKLISDELVMSMVANADRKSTGLAAQLYNDTSVVDVVIKQISMRGILVLTPKGWTYDPSLDRVRIFVEGDGISYDVKAVVTDPKKFLVGFRFKNVSRLKNIILYELLSNL